MKEYTKMKVEYKNKLVEALRSGKYSQIERNLRNKDGFCCLGVLCDIVNPELWEKVSYSDSYVYYNSNKVTYDQYKLPEEVSKITGLVWEDSRILAELNDSGKTFEYIAKHIKENL